MITAQRHDLKIGTVPTAWTFGPVGNVNPRGDALYNLKELDMVKWYGLIDSYNEFALRFLLSANED